MNTYAYVSGNPVNLYDFFGLCACQRPTSNNFWNAYPNYNAFNATSVCCYHNRERHCLMDSRINRTYNFVPVLI
uniref:hypothetical protein n=1 Tax=Microbulbifer thermotolerans TaxID=252514 RepID=UPI001E47D9D4|nr:hypothetical protein [Microbulbifer thermotolerans]